MSYPVWLGFLAASILIAVSPGPGAAISMSTGLRYGYPAALRAIFGLQCALLCQLAVVAGGLGALLATSSTAFHVVKLVGAGYLIWLGIQKWRTADAGVAESAQAADGTATVPDGLFLQGLLVNLTNPKAVVFIAALVPQFLDPARSQWLQFVVIGGTMCSIDIIVMSCYALLASHLSHWLRDAPALRLQNRLFGGIFVGAGLWLAGSSRN